MATPKTTTKSAATETLVDLIPESEARADLFRQFTNEVTDAGLKPVDADLKIAGKRYRGPAVVVRDLNLVRNATKLLTLTHPAEAQGAVYVLPLLEPVALD